MLDAGNGFKQTRRIQLKEKAIQEESTITAERATERESATGQERAKSGKGTKGVERSGAPSGAPLTKVEARFLVDSFYTIQDYRKTAANQLRAATPENEQPSEILKGFLAEYEGLEHRMQRELERFAKSSEIGRWALSVCGIGPIITAGLLAEIDIAKAPTVGHVWAFAGLAPGVEWKKGEKRPWNARLKTLCWKASDSFVKVSNRESDIYGKVYRQRKELEQERNERGEFAEQARHKLETTKIGKDTEAWKWYSIGKLPPAHIDMRARRYAVKLFLAHMHEVWYRLEVGAPPLPYPIAFQGHAHKKDPPQ
mgnify:CR=1 FL=1